jgi:methyl-accepting chemotaxis protein
LKPKRATIFVMRGFQLRYVGLVAGSLLVMLVFAGVHSLYMTQTILTGDAVQQFGPQLHASTFRFFLVGFLYIGVVVIAALFLSHRAVGPTRRIEDEIRKIAADKDAAHALKVREGDDFESLIHAINELMAKKPQERTR